LRGIRDDIILSRESADSRFGGATTGSVTELTQSEWQVALRNGSEVSLRIR